MTQTVGVIGSGISGLATAWTLVKEGYKVTLYEADPKRFGGHSFTYHEPGHYPVDLGFQVFNLTTYPYLVEMFEQLGVDHEPSDMSFALSVNNGEVEWASNDNGLRGLFAQRSNLYSPRFLNMLREVIRFGRQGLEVLNGDKLWSDMTLGEYLKKRCYSSAFRDHYLLPMTAAVWSVPDETMLDFPIVPLVKFWENHHLMNPLGARPRWRVVKARSETYVNAIIAELESNGDCEVLLGTKVKKVKRSETNVTVSDFNGGELVFDHVVLASHSDQSLAMLEEDPNTEDKMLLSKIRFQENEVYLHQDRQLMPTSKDAWASWNVLDNSKHTNHRSVCVTYWLNHLQNLPDDSALRLCTLNPIYKPEPALVIDKFILEHPIFDKAAIEAQMIINRRQANYKENGDCRVWFAGAWLGNGFHEDGIRSAVAVCTAINKGKLPKWAVKAGAPPQPALKLIRGPSPEITISQQIGLQLFESLASRGIRKGFLRLILPNGNDLCFGRDNIKEAELLSEPIAIVHVHDLSMMIRCIRDSDVGLGEAYIEKLYSTDNLCSFLQILIQNNKRLRESLIPSGFSGLTSILGSILYKIGNYALHLQHLGKKNTIVGSRRNIEEHYDLGNDMYELFLDDTMTYSAGIHRKKYGANVKHENDELDLLEAQYAKLDEIIRRAQLKKDDHVLEIGCGWGSFAIRAASKIGCKVTGITISTEQLKLAKARVEKLGLADKIDLIICDYRTLGTPGSEYNPGMFDKIVSIEMIEAVGHEHLPEYFETINRMLKVGGRACIQAISMKNEKYVEYCNSSDFIRRHIFPGGHLPCMDAIKWATEETDLAIEENFDIGPDYAVTLRMWKENFLLNRDKIIALGYPETFIRKWIFYFAYCEAGFEEKHILNFQIAFVKDALIHKKQMKLHKLNPDRLIFDPTSTDKVSLMAETKTLQSTATPAPLPMISTAVPAALWAMSAIVLESKEMQLISTIAVLAVFIVSLLGNVFYKSYLRPPSLISGRRSRNTWTKYWIDTLFSCLVVITVIVSMTLYEVPRMNPNHSPSCAHDGNCATFAANVNVQGLATDNTMDSFLVVNMLLFASFGRLAATTARTLKLDEVLPYLLHSLNFSVVMLFALNTTNSSVSSIALIVALLHGFGELHSLARGSRKLLSLQGGRLDSNKSYRLLWLGDIVTLASTKILPLLVLLVYKASFFVSLVTGKFNTRTAFLPERMLMVAIFGLIFANFRIAYTVYKELRHEYENTWNTQELVGKFSRSREELIKNMASTSAQRVTDRKKLHISTLYRGFVMHSRSKVANVSPAANSFQYKIWMAYIDLEEAENNQAFRNVPFISVNSSWNFATWHRNDYYGAETGKPLRQCIQEIVKKRLNIIVDGPITLLTNLRCFGYGFNPVSVYYCFDKEQCLKSVVLEVTNTPWLAKRIYVIPVSEDNPTFTWNKDFHVSPFMDVYHEYEWTLYKPNEKILINARSFRREPQTKPDEPWIQTTGDTSVTPALSSPNKMKTFHVRLNLERLSKTPELIKCLLYQPIMTFSIIFWIHYQAAKVMWKKCEYQLAPSNQHRIGIRELMKHLFLFAVALLWEFVSFLFWPFSLLYKSWPKALHRQEAA